MHQNSQNRTAQQELNKLRGELSQHTANVEQADEQAEDLKGLLQQFTKDSRDIKSFIQKLEAENANLRQQLGLTGGDAGAGDDVGTELPATADEDVSPGADRAEESAA
jgi:DNA repair exonuclease SbcCD ATPase subunit